MRWEKEEKNVLKEWIVAQHTDEGDALAAEIGVTPIIGQLLWQRGIRTAEEAHAFLHPADTPFHDPLLMADMERGAERVLRAVRRGEPIVIYGDYDVDGMTATALLMRSIRALGGKVSYYIPNRFTEGYGLNADALQQIAGGAAAFL